MNQDLTFVSDLAQLDKRKTHCLLQYFSTK